MPSVPKYDSLQVQQAGYGNIGVSPVAPAEAFGAGQSNENVNQAAAGVLDESRKIALEEKRKADQVAFMGADRQASELQTQIQVHVSQMKGQDAFAAPDVAAKQWNDSVTKIKDGLANEEQQKAFDQAATNRWEELNRNTQFHVASEQKVFDEDQTNAYLKASKNAAVVSAHDDVAVSAELERQTSVAQQWAKRNGLSGSEAEKSKIAEITSGTMRDVIAARIDGGNTQGAVAYLNAHKADLTAEDSLHAQKIVEQGKTLDAGVAAWNQVQGMKLADGNPDEARMEHSVLSRSDLSTKEKLEVLSFVKARAREETMNKNREDAASERSFMNTVIKGRQDGQPLEDALKVANQSGKDAYDQAIKSEAVKKIYAPPSSSDPATFVSLWERIQDKSVDKSDIDLKMQQNMINAADWRSLREDYYKVNSDGKNDKEKNAYERVRILAQEQFGSDKDSSEKFMYDLHQANKGKSPEEIWKDANDKLKPATGTGLSLFGFNTGLFQTPQYKTDVERLDAQNLAWGKLHQDIGRKETNAIGQGILYGGKKTWNVGDVDAFANELGGYQNIQAGTKGHDAIQFLIRHNKLVTPANVKAVLERSSVGEND